MSEIHVPKRETEIIHWMSEGKTADEIGTILGISGFTVKTMIIRARERLDAVNSAQLVAKAIRCGIIQ